MTSLVTNVICYTPLSISVYKRDPLVSRTSILLINITIVEVGVAGEVLSPKQVNIKSLSCN